MKSEEQRRMLLETVQSDQRLSALARTLMLYMLAANAGNGQAKPLELSGIAEELGLTEPKLRLSALELAANDYVVVTDDGAQTKVILLWDGADNEDEPLGGRVFAQTMQSLRIPENLQPDYAQIYWSLAENVREFIVPENRGLIQRVLDRVSALMDAGEIDYRGPTGLIVYILKRSSQVPLREFAG